MKQTYSIYIEIYSKEPFTFSSCKHCCNLKHWGEGMTSHAVGLRKWENKPNLSEVKKSRLNILGHCLSCCSFASKIFTSKKIVKNWRSKVNLEWGGGGSAQFPPIIKLIKNQTLIIKLQKFKQSHILDFNLSLER